VVPDRNQSLHRPFRSQLLEFLFACEGTAAFHISRALFVDGAACATMPRSQWYWVRFE
jgi:hypothetical protein